jgi:hypothetical protein
MVEAEKTVFLFVLKIISHRQPAEILPPVGKAPS